VKRGGDVVKWKRRYREGKARIKEEEGEMGGGGRVG
jgi:hypothetical protein